MPTYIMCALTPPGADWYSATPVLAPGSLLQAAFDTYAEATARAEEMLAAAPGSKIMICEAMAIISAAPAATTIELL